jgi:hypothetical protein
MSALRLMSSNYLATPISTVDESVIRTMKNAEYDVTRLNILQAIRSGQELFNSIAADTYGDNAPSDCVKLSRKQYYNKLSKLIKVDVIKRKSGRYLLTPFGRVIYGVQLGFSDAVDNNLKTKIKL